MTFPSTLNLNKTKMIAWFCSHKSTHSRREDYAKELGRYIQIDVYGKCGNLSCEPRNSAECDALVLPEYKFYLAAENSLCNLLLEKKNDAHIIYLFSNQTRK